MNVINPASPRVAQNKKLIVTEVCETIENRVWDLCLREANTRYVLWWQVNAVGEN